MILSDRQFLFFLQAHSLFQNEAERPCQDAPCELDRIERE
jgi:hypothetical protein